MNNPTGIPTPRTDEAFAKTNRDGASNNYRLMEAWNFAGTLEIENVRLREEVDEWKNLHYAVWKDSSESIATLTQQRDELKRQLESVIQNYTVSKTMAWEAIEKERDELKTEVERLKSKLDQWAIDHPTICYQCGVVVGKQSEWVKRDVLEKCVEAMQQLHDYQNGSPLPKYDKQWSKAMNLTEEALDLARTELGKGEK